MRTASVLLTLLVLAGGCERSSPGRYQLARGGDAPLGAEYAWRLDTQTGEMCFFIGSSNGVNKLHCSD
jgi:hypothetical protein